MGNENFVSVEETNRIEKAGRKAYSAAGLGWFAMQALGYAVYYLVLYLFPDVRSTTLGVWLMSFAPLYFVGLPVCVLIFLRVPAYKGVDGKGSTASLTTGQIVRAVFIGFFLLRLGGFIGDHINEFLCSLAGTSTDLSLDTLLSSGPLVVKILIIGIMGPLVEELIFRKLLIDRISCYGEKLAVITSGLMFGFFHGNFSQFFYAWFLGMMFAYIYLKTGKYRYSAGLHIFFNSLGVFEAAFLLSISDIIANFETASGGDLVLPIIWGLIEFVAIIIGLILFLRCWRKPTYEPARMELPKGSRFRTAYLNIGMLLFVALSIVLIVRNIML